MTARGRNDRPARRGRPAGRGLGLVELLVALVCFVLALVPLLNLYSQSVDSARVIQARSVMFAAALEVFGRCMLLPPASLPEGRFVIAPDGRSANPLPACLASLTVVPAEITRTVFLYRPDPQDQETVMALISVRHADLPQLDINWERTFVRDRGGRR
ncbi:MAG: hypothetical protein OZSIB_3529 [Candidatus Ozemobacter sibiricus]|jgi:hypothetical protein|uniref:Uncharacterized protein n=1 Tax=Candidatus Ozemobacter sibiricus TaxID=2268124 RepID=A0A367ZR74_9BACT|nr:MAG: hypothetical protein OZSIB_3529 [Candidatus Ozemobacter sibiricus]